MKKQRDSNLELLRIVCMLFIVLGHAVTHAGYDVFPVSINGIVALASTQGSRIAVNCFVIITGYFMVEGQVKPKKVIAIYQQVLVYSLGILIFTACAFHKSFSVKEFIAACLPVTTSEYWFATCYVLLLLVSPILNTYVSHTNQKQLTILLVIFGIYWCIAPTLYLGAPGYNNFVWFVYLYLIAAYIRKYSLPLQGKIRVYHAVFLLIGISLLTVFVYYFGMPKVFFQSNAIYMFGEMNRLPALLCSIVAFLGFSNLEISRSSVINKIAGCTFGIYLLHDNPNLRQYLWSNLSHNFLSLQNSFYPINLFLIVIGIYIFGIFVELVRQGVTRKMGKITFLNSVYVVLKKIYGRLRIKVWTKCHEKNNQVNRNRLKVTDTTILSMNCTGGILSHDLGLQFLSPTVNLFFKAEDFIKFCENLEYYIGIDKFVECTDPEVIGDRTYPIVHLGDLTLFLVHYHSVEEAQEKWNSRKKRINWKNIVVLDTDREGMTDELKDRFEKLPYRKVMFVNKPDKAHPSCFYIKGYEDQNCVGIITDSNTWDGRRPVDQFDWVALINGD